MDTQTQTTTAQAQTDENFRERVQDAIKALATYGVSEEMIHGTAHLSTGRWTQLKQSATGITSRELACLSGALLQETIYLLTGDERNRVKFSPCSWTAMVQSLYPESEIAS